MKFNISLVCVGLMLLLGGFLRMGVIKFDRNFAINLLPILIVLIGVLFAAYYVGGGKLVTAGLENGGKMIVTFSPMLIIMFILMGVVGVLLIRYQPQFVGYLGGTKGLLGSLVSSFLMPGSITGLPIIRQLWDSGASPGPLLLFLLTSPLIGWQMVLVQYPILGWRLTGICFGLRFLTSVGLFLIVGAFRFLTP